MLKLLGRLTVWKLLPNGRRTSFFNLWAGLRRPDRYWAEVRDDLSHVLDLLAQGEITAQVAARFRLSEAAAALSYAEAGGYTGKVIIVRTPNCQPTRRISPPSPVAGYLEAGIGGIARGLAGGATLCHQAITPPRSARENRLARSGWPRQPAKTQAPQTSRWTSRTSLW